MRWPWRNTREATPEPEPWWPTLLAALVDGTRSGRLHWSQDRVVHSYLVCDLPEARVTVVDGVTEISVYVHNVGGIDLPILTVPDLVPAIRMSIERDRANAVQSIITTATSPTPPLAGSVIDG